MVERQPLKVRGLLKSAMSPRAVTGAFWFWLGLLAPALLLFGSVGIGWWSRRRDSSEDLRKLKAAPKNAREVLRAAEELAAAGDQKASLEKLTSGLVGYLATRLEVQPGSITNARLATQLKNRGVEAETIEALLTLRQSCDEARFSTLESEDALALVKAGQSVLKALEDKI